MKLIRIIPSLLVKDNFLVKGENFKKHSYIGDVYNAVKIFSEKNSHEIILLDIDARRNKKSFNLDLIKKIKKEIFVPLTIGGGIENIDQVSAIIDEGVEKVSLNSNIEKNFNLVEQVSKKFGSQSSIASIDVRKIDNKYKVYFRNGEKFSDLDLIKYIKNLENAGCGEIILTSIDNEGKRCGFDIELYKLCHELVSIPIIAHGGAANLNSFIDLFDNTKISAASGGSCFVYYGKRKAVLINYPNKLEINELMNKYEKN